MGTFICVQPQGWQYGGVALCMRATDTLQRRARGLAHV